MLEVPFGVPVLLRQRNPQLDAVDDGRARVETSEWAMPYPPVMRLISPGRTKAWVPSVSRCSTSPLNSQVTVCRPVCGCGASAMPPLSATASGP